MPELPEVESVVRDMLAAEPSLTGSRIRSAELYWPGIVKDQSIDAFLEKLIGSKVFSVSRYGKYLFFLIGKSGPEIYLVMHLRMTGILYPVDISRSAGQYCRLSIDFENGLSLRFDDPRKFGRVWLVVDPLVVTAGLGPDALTVTSGEFLLRMKSGNRQLKTVLLDQSFVAGIGNIYADESLFLAGLHPLRKSQELGDAEIMVLHKSVVAVLEEAVAARGANIDGVFKAGNYIVRVYGRQGRPCMKCGQNVVKIRVGQRGTHFCPVCQPLM